MRRAIKVKPRFWMCVIIGTLMLFGILYIVQNSVMNSQKTQISALEQQRAERIEENDALKRYIDFSKTDEYVERYARSELGYLKEGEIRFVEGGYSD